MMGAELPHSHHGIEGIGFARKAWRANVEASFRGQFVGKACLVPQFSGLTAPDTIVNSIERPYGVRQHVGDNRGGGEARAHNDLASSVLVQQHLDGTARFQTQTGKFFFREQPRRADPGQHH